MSVRRTNLLPLGQERLASSGHPRSTRWHGAKDLNAPKTSRSCRCRRALNRIFKYFDEIVDHYCYAWNTLIDQPWKIISIARRDWAVAGHLL